MVCDKGFVWNPSSCNCECNKSCGIGEECTSVIDENKIYNETLSVISSDECSSCMLYFVLLAVFLTTSVIIGGFFVYFHWHLRRNDELDRKKRKGKVQI